MAARMDVECFVAEVGNYRFLYDKSSKEYKNIQMKRAVWELVGKKFEMSALEAEKRWKVQRDRYNKEKKKYKESKFSGSGLTDVYVPKWKLYSVMDSLLSNCIENSSSISSIDLKTSAEEQLAESSALIDSQVIDDDDDNNDDEELMSTEIDTAKETDTASPPFSCASFSTPTPGSSKSRKRKRDDSNEDFIVQMKETSLTIADYFKKKNTTEDDSVVKFCDYLACRLKNLKKKHRRDAMHAIENLMQKKEIDDDE